MPVTRSVLSLSAIACPTATGWCAGKPIDGLSSARCVGSWARDAAKKSWPEVRPFDAPRDSEAPREKIFAEPRLPEKVLKPVERAGAAICANHDSVAEIVACGRALINRGLPAEANRGDHLGSPATGT